MYQCYNAAFSARFESENGHKPSLTFLEGDGMKEDESHLKLIHKYVCEEDKETFEIPADERPRVLIQIMGSGVRGEIAFWDSEIMIDPTTYDVHAELERIHSTDPNREGKKNSCFIVDGYSGKDEGGTAMIGYHIRYVFCVN